MSLIKHLKRKGLKPKDEILWKGPGVDGITFSLLSRFLVCRERFRLLVIKGLRPARSFNHRIEYGNMWHVCEEAHARWPKDPGKWQVCLKMHCVALLDQYPYQTDEVNKWYNVCKRQFPEYVDFWKSEPDVKGRVPILQEETFKVPYDLPDGRTVYLRGKWDSVDYIKDGLHGHIFCQENKTKADIDEVLLLRQLKYDLQTNIYLVALREYWKQQVEVPNSDFWVKNQHVRPQYTMGQKIGGIRYNVIRRPLGGGRHSIHQKKRESKKEFYERLGERIRSEPKFFFMRWRIDVSPRDVKRFEDQTLRPLLVQLYDWYDWILWCHAKKKSVFGTGPHWRHPFGVYNVLDEGGSTEMDSYLETGSTAGLEVTKSLFEELQ
jgi:hypothetical protein